MPDLIFKWFLKFKKTIAYFDWMSETYLFYLGRQKLTLWGKNLDFWAQTKSLAKIGKFGFKPSSGSNIAFQANIGKQKQCILHLKIDLHTFAKLLEVSVTPKSLQSTHKILGTNSFIVKLQSESHQIALHIAINESGRARNCNAK